jgi:hypothetical protein
MSAKDLINRISEKNEYWLSRKGMPQPEVGPFWVWQGRVYGSGVPLNDAEFDMGGYKYDRTLHAHLRFPGEGLYFIQKIKLLKFGAIQKFWGIRQL